MGRYVQVVAAPNIHGVATRMTGVDLMSAKKAMVLVGYVEKQNFASVIQT